MPVVTPPNHAAHTDLGSGLGESAHIATSKVVTTVFEQILNAIHDGRLMPGAHINDNKVAEKLGVSRTPVREALQRLREIGVVEASASRFTRVAVVSPQQTADAMVVWTALFGAVLEETIPSASDDVVEAMTVDHAAFTAAVSAMDMQSVATSNFTFFSRLTALSKNDALKRAITTVVHLVRLGSLHLPDYIDFNALSEAQATIIKAAKQHDLELAHEAMKEISGIRVPTTPLDD